MKRQPKVPTGRRSGLEIRLRLDGSAPLFTVSSTHTSAVRAKWLSAGFTSERMVSAGMAPRGAWTRRTLAPLLRDATALVVVDVVAPVTDHLIARLGVDVDGHLVGHGPDGQNSPAS